VRDREKLLSPSLHPSISLALHPVKDRSSTVRFHWYALLAYFWLTLVLTYPLVLHFTTHVAGDGSDDPALAWNLWWVRYALLNLGQSPIYTNYMFFPIGLNLGFYTLTYLNAFLSIPFQFTLGLIPAANINLFLSFTLSGFGAYLLVTYLLARDSIEWNSTSKQSGGKNKAETTEAKYIRVHPPLSASQISVAAFAAGLLYAFSSNKFLYASLGQFNIASSQWIPFYLLFLLKIFDTPKPPLKYGFLLGLFLLAQALSELIFASFLILFTIAFVMYRILATRGKLENANRERFDKSKIENLFIAVVVCVIPMSPILAAMLSDTLTEGDFIQQGLGFSNIFSADLLGFFIPSHLHPFFGFLESRFSFSYLNFMYLGFTALALGILALWKVKPARIWGIWFAIIALVTLGPTLRVNGAEYDLPLPFDVLLEIPFIKGNRYPSRWSVMLTLTLAILVGYGIAYCVLRIAYRKSHNGTRNTQYAAVFTCVVGLLFLFEHLSTPLPISNLQSPSIYSEIARDAGNFSVMEIPLAWRNGFRVTGSYRADSQAPIDRIFMYAQFFQTTQQHPILNGNTSRNPELKFQYFSETPVLNSLLAIQEGHDIDAATRARDKNLAPRVLQFFGTQYIIWHAPFEEANRDVANKTRAYIEETFPVTKINESYENGRGTVTYRVNDLPANDTLILKPDDPLARLYLGEGWGALGGEAFWAQRNQAKLFFSLDAQRALTLTLQNFVLYPSAGHGLTVRVNGKQIAQYHPIPVTDGTFRVNLPASVLQSGVNEIEFGFDATVPINQIPVHPPSIVVRSAGEEQGAFGHIYVNGVDESPNARGYNIVVIEPRTGQVVARANFDTFLSGRESLRMAQFINQVAEGDLVAVAVSDEASQHLTEQAVNALQTIGARQDLRGKFRWSQAVLGVKDSPAGSASEAAAATNVSQVILNLPLTEPRVAASIGEIRIAPVQ
jgi:hypothetical protein